MFTSLDEAPLKALQGKIWRAGYECGELEGHVYEDAVRASRKWRASGLEIHIDSSGSIEAQKLLFAHTAHGDPVRLARYDACGDALNVVRSVDEIVLYGLSDA